MLFFDGSLSYETPKSKTEWTLSSNISDSYGKQTEIVCECVWEGQKPLSLGANLVGVDLRRKRTTTFVPAKVPRTRSMHRVTTGNFSCCLVMNSSSTTTTPSNAVNVDEKQLGPTGVRSLKAAVALMHVIYARELT